MANQEHLETLEQGVEAWNEWRDSNPEVRPDLRNANFTRALLAEANLGQTDLRWSHLSGANLRMADLSGSDLSSTNSRGAVFYKACLDDAMLRHADLGAANLTGASLWRADLSQCDLSWATLRGANLKEAILVKSHLRGVNLVDAELSRANVMGADLSFAQLVGTSLAETNIAECNVYGISAWELDLSRTRQANLVITQPDQPAVTVDNLEVAQFVYLFMHNEKIHDVIDTITSKVVLILGRFSEERKAVLDAIREELRLRNFTPVLFDFDPSSNQDITDTVTLLARMARFVIADLTDAASVQQELTLIAPQVMVAIRPIILTGQKPWSMFPDLKRRSWGLLDVFEYPDLDGLLQQLDEYVIDPAEAKRNELLPAVAAEDR